jgi:hypothetical protein
VRIVNENPENNAFKDIPQLNGPVWQEILLGDATHHDIFGDVGPADEKNVTLRRFNCGERYVIKCRHDIPICIENRTGTRFSPNNDRSVLVAVCLCLDDPEGRNTQDNGKN